MNRLHFRVSIWLLLIASCIASLPAAFAEEDGGSLSELRTLVKRDVIMSVATLQRGREGKNGPTFVFAVIDNAKDWKAFSEGSDKLPAEPDIDWLTQAVLFVAYEGATGAVYFTSWTEPDAEGVGRFRFFFHSIEPDYIDRYPAVIHTIPRNFNEVKIILAEKADEEGVALGSVKIE